MLFTLFSAIPPNFFSSWLGRVRFLRPLGTIRRHSSTSLFPLLFWRRDCSQFHEFGFSSCRVGLPGAELILELFNPHAAFLKGWPKFGDFASHFIDYGFFVNFCESLH
jgi:hypothetical protein